MRKMFNAGNVSGAAAVLAVVGAVGAVCGAVEGECSCVTVVLFLAASAGCAYLSFREDGKIR